ncbi:MAG: phosphodiesterase [Candidatus Eremiobacteraeota bacterium]|nr:phosphodiesterase [Candidatus Eremiobacteraeota bacterium]MBC5826735.1 phosphodiesterase [Candidatus Eremiobacteraeota bacterium]
MPPRKPFFIQISDTHLFEDPAARLWDVAPDAMLDRTLDVLLAAAADPEFVLVTGDCSGDGSRQSYLRLRDKLNGLSAPVHYLPGNHDDPVLMAKLFAGRELAPHAKLVQVFDTCGWRLILLDSAVPGQDGGCIGSDQRIWLGKTLEAAPLTPTIVAMHHNPLPVGSAWLDAMTIADAEPLLKILDGAAQVKSVLFGHIHQQFDVRRNGTAYMSVPSTFFQFKPRSPEFAGDRGSQAAARIVSLSGDRADTVLVGADGSMPLTAYRQ